VLVGLVERVALEFTRAEKRFIDDNDVARIATVGSDGTPHVVPVCYVHNSGAFWVATDYGTRKYRNLQKNNKVALVIDVGNASNRGVLVRGRAKTFDRGPEFRAIYDVFYRKFDWVREMPWKEGEAPFVKIEPTRKVSWGLEQSDQALL
jgi:nitroimidazol reductase NimA-like FMN-containing flavoprotein (pyridoxamine 5'-phosphate oxidase superfamily)